ncbi:tolB protein precursor, periplasmic protein involved in the tonb-independent uptake of group A colicins [uncultured Candidatus Thioglobus sp.]|nr:tolB protein precursor, periplasmic protein involved in the tonb-independent uptake of group A colicins [uncultured Candidatus Thioglobus sp.]
MKRLILLLILSVSVAQAALEVTVIKKDENAFPIAVSPFKTVIKGVKIVDIAKIIHDNLERSGRFNVLIADTPVNEINPQYWKEQGVEALVTGSIEQEIDKVYRLSISLFDLYGNTELFSRSTRVHANGFRKLAHLLSDHIYEALLGENGSFNTLLTYVTVTNDARGGREYQLNIADSDAKNVRSRVKLKTPILSPVWSPDKKYKNKKIAYVSFQNDRPEVFIWHPFVRKSIQKIPRFDGLASSPNWHPDGKSLVLTLSKNGNKDIYAYNLANKQLTRLTSNPSIDTEASYSPDGKRLAFTSNRSGQVQIYIKNLVTGKINRATFSGSYNAKATFSPDGKSLALVHRVDGDYRIAMLDIETQELNILSNRKLDESPHFSPNGDMIIFSSNNNNKGVLSVISVEGNREYELSSHDGEVREPNWSTHLEQ